MVCLMKQDLTITDFPFSDKSIALPLFWGFFVFKNPYEQAKLSFASKQRNCSLHVQEQVFELCCMAERMGVFCDPRVVMVNSQS